MREIGRQCPQAQLILHQCCSRCLALSVMRNLAAKQKQRLNLPFLCTVHIMPALLLTQVEEHVLFHVPCVRIIYVLHSRCMVNNAGGIMSF